MADEKVTRWQYSRLLPIFNCHRLQGLKVIRNLHFGPEADGVKGKS